MTTHSPIDNPEFVDALLVRIGDTNWSAIELYAIGEALVSWVNVTEQLGHSSPGDSLDYVPATGVLWNDYVRDFIAWTAHRQNRAPGCEERLRKHNTESGWAAHKMRQFGSALSKAMGNHAA